MPKLIELIAERARVTNHFKGQIDRIRAQAETQQRIYHGVIGELDDQIKKTQAEEAEQAKRLDAQRKERAEKAKEEFKENARRIWESQGGSAEDFEKNFEEIYTQFLKDETARRIAGDGGAAQYAQTVRGWNG
jgi:hypothetical protein